MNKDSTPGFFTGLMIGAVIGLALGFLYAPQPGEETRRMVKEKAGTVKEGAAKAAGRVRDAVKSRINQEEE
jgi:gas vesicle protein